MNLPPIIEALASSISSATLTTFTHHLKTETPSLPISPEMWLLSDAIGKNKPTPKLPDYTKALASNVTVNGPKDTPVLTDPAKGASLTT